MSANPRDELVFLPLGGSNEIGMNLNAYGFGPPDDRRWIIVDVGVTFGDASTPSKNMLVSKPTTHAPAIRVGGEYGRHERDSSRSLAPRCLSRHESSCFVATAQS